MKVYMDTIAWNAVHDRVQTGSIEFYRGPEYLFSSCDLDEFCLSESPRARELANFAWELSNRKKLLDHVELTAAEIASYQQGTALQEPYDEDPRLIDAWAYVRRDGVPPEMHAALKADMEQTKRNYRSGMRLTRDIFRPVFDKFAAIGIEQNWRQILGEMNDEDLISTFLTNLLEHEGLLDRVPDPQRISDIDYVNLPATACWLEYYIAVSFLAAFESGKHARPDLGEQVDYRHACYAGIADTFVTADDRMMHILQNMVLHRRAEVVTPDELQARLGRE